MTLTQLADARPGALLGNIRHGGGQVIETAAVEGILPDPHGDLEVLLALDSMGKTEMAVGVENIHDGIGEVGIEIPEGKDIKDPILMNRIITMAMERSGVKHGSLNPKVATLPKDILPKVGFYPDPAGDTYTLSLAA